jgi:hypothetical protein
MQGGFMAQKTAKPKAASQEADADFGSVSEQIASLAYVLWQERGSPEGNPEEDWFRAEQEIRVKQQSQSEIVHALTRVRRNRRVSQAAQA